MSNPVKVLVIDDSATVRKVLSKELAKDPQIDVVGTALDPIIAFQKIKTLNPDVLTLDIEMPRMDGLTFLGKLMTQHPLPVIIVSSLTPTGCETALKAFELGALDVLTKPSAMGADGLDRLAVELRERVKAAAKVDRNRLRKKETSEKSMLIQADKIVLKTTQKLIAIGSSTGGTKALDEVLGRLPKDFPGILIVQHLPKMFTTALANRLNTLCAIDVREACNGDTVRQGLALLAPGDKHMLLRRSGTRYFVEVKHGPRVGLHRPAVDVLFNSVAKAAGPNALGVMLTGMGKDGARGMRLMHDRGAINIAQDEASCIVFGMPKEAIGHGGVDHVVSLASIAAKLVQLLSAKRARAPKSKVSVGA